MDLKAGIDIGDNLTKLLEKLAAQIGTTADKVFPWYVAQAKIEGYVGLGAVCFGITAALVLFIAGFYNRDEREKKLTLYGIGGALLVFSVLGACAGGADILGRIYNPEMFALRSLLADLGGLTH